MKPSGSSTRSGTPAATLHAMRHEGRAGLDRRIVRYS